jgi:hypothetical protein
MAILSTRFRSRGTVHTALHRLSFQITGAVIALTAGLPLHAPPTTLPVLVAGRLLLALGRQLRPWFAPCG